MARWIGLALATLLCVSGAANAAEDYPINVILSTSGNAAFLGQMRQRTLQVMETMLNDQGGIGVRPIRFVFHDDQTSPQTTVQITSALLAEKPAVVLGASITGTCNAELPLVRANGPVAYCFSPGEHPPPGSYMFSAQVSTRDLLTTMLRYFAAKGWTRIATITSSDATGAEMEEGFDEAFKQPEFAKLGIVEHTRFNLNDVSVAAQLERIRAATPDVLIAWTTGTAVAGIFKGMIQAGLNIPVATSNGNQSIDVMHQFAAFLPHPMLIARPSFPRHTGLFKLDPAIEAKQQVYYAEMDKAGLPIDLNTAGVWDATLLVVDALRALGPKANPAQVREWLAGLKGFAGIHGMYDFVRTPQRGIGGENALITEWDSQGDRWLPVSLPGGKPLDAK